MSSDVDIAWAAGLFEGEGCFSANSPGIRDARKRRGVIACLTSADLDVLERFQAIVGVGSIIALKRDKRWPSHKPLWKWQAQAREHVVRVGDLLRPWLGQRRVARLDEVLAVTWEHDPLICAYCSSSFIPQRVRCEPVYCSRTCAARGRAGVVNPRVKELANG